MKPSLLPAAIALAACSFDLQGLDLAGDDLVELQLTPAGSFKPTDGRPMDVPAWRIDAAIASRVIERFKARANPAVIDYEHQSLHKETNGQPAPAAAWIRELVWHEGRGLFGRAELTARAREAIRAKEYRYLSPVFRFHPKTGDVLALEMAAITNTPAIDGMEPLALRAAATFGTHLPNEEETTMNKLLLAVLTALALKPETTEDEAITALTAHNPLAKIRTAIGVEDATDEAGVIAACTTLRTQATAAVDPTKFVPIAAVEQLQGSVATLTAKVRDREVDDLVKPALASGKLLPAMEGWARDLGKSNIAALTAFLDKAQPVAALNATQTGGKEPPVVGNEHQLTASEIAVCSAAGISQADFASAKKATPAPHE